MKILCAVDSIEGIYHGETYCGSNAAQRYVSPHKEYYYKYSQEDKKNIMAKV